MRPNKSLGRIKVFRNVEIWIFLVWIILHQSIKCIATKQSPGLSTTKPSLIFDWSNGHFYKCLALGSLAGRKLPDNAKGFCDSGWNIDSAWNWNMSFNWKAQLVGQKNWSWMPLCDGWEHSAASEKLSGEAFEGGQECATLQYQATTKLAF